jgi:uncharacterized protein (TIGR03437 family)
MFNRYVSLVARLCLVALVCLAMGATAFAQSSGYLFQLPGANVPGSRFFGFVYDANPFSPAVDKSGPLSATQVIAKPDGTKFYFIGSGSGGVQSIDKGFNTFQSINGILGNATTAAITPDGKFLLVGGASLYIIDTSNDTVLSNTANITGTITSIAISRDSKTAYVLSNSAFGSAVYGVNLTNRTAAFSLPYNVPFGGATSIALSPLGLLYVAEINRLYEVDPTTLTQTANGEIDLVATPGNLHFTPDGQYVFFVNLTPNTGGQSILKVALSGHSVTTWPPFTGNPPPAYSDCYVISNTRVIAFSPSTTTLWDITPSPLGGVVSQLSAIVPVQSVIAVAISGEIPAARFLYLLVTNGNQTNIDRIDLATNTLSVQASDILNTGIFDFVSVPPQSGAATFVTYNNQQVVKAGAVPAPLIARVADSTGRPVFNAAATFSVDSSSGVTITTPNQVTNADGYVQTTVTLPATAGTYTVTLTVGGATTSYTLTVPGAGVTGPGAIQQVNIISGNGQMVLYQHSTFLGGQPLGIKVTDANGVALDKEPVTFTITSGAGDIVNTDSATHDGGFAYTDFSATTAPSQQSTTGITQSFQVMDVNAATSVGSVDFSVVVYIIAPDGVTNQPQADILAPTLDNNRTINAGVGQSLPNAVQAIVHSSYLSQSPIPGVGIRIASATDTTMPGPATCTSASTLSDNTGVSSCTLVASCQLTPGVIYPFLISVGEYRFFPANLKVGLGQPSNLTITQGNNQSGKAGDNLPQTLFATVSDPCGNQVAGVGGTWSVVSGSATLQHTISTSDAAGRFATNVTLGQIPGPIQVRLAVPNVGNVVFNLTNSVVVSSVTLVSGSGQTGFTAAAFPQPIVFQVRDGQGNPIPGILVSFNLVSGSASVNPSTANTDTQGRAATTITAGATAGSITISATSGGITANASVTSQPPGLPLTATSYVNAASFAPGLVPCGLASASAPGLASSISGVLPGSSGFGPLPYTLGGLSMTINGIPVPLYALSNSNNVQQVTFQTPCETPVGSATVVTIVNGGVTTVTGVPVLQAQPGIFTYAGPNGKLYGAVIRALDGTYVTPSSLAHRGETYYVVATGLGQVTPPTSTNAAGTGSQTVAAPVVVGINNAGVPTNPAQYVQGSIGVYIVGFQIPQSATTGTDQPLALAIVLNGQNIFGNQVVYIPGVQ